MTQTHNVPDADLLIIGGGINGAGIARDAAGRGLRVILCDKGDFGGATSSASTKLIHGGLRYLEHLEFRLVSESLKEREVLLSAAPHIIWPLRFVLPHLSGLRPAWLLRMGLMIYDGLGGRERLPRSRRLVLKDDPLGAPLDDRIRTGFSYYDCWAQDNRLVIANLQDAERLGAVLLPHSICRSARRENGCWRAVISGPDGDRHVSARTVVNAAGPWVGSVSASLGMNARHRVRLVKGSHIVTRRLFDHDSAYLFQHEDQRVIFAIPYERDFTLIGTTDVEMGADPERPEASGEEIAYLCRAVSRYFKRPVGPEDVVWSYAGVRPLHGDEDASASAVSRDYRLELQDEQGAPLLTVLGGKLTTYRRLAEAAVNRLAETLETKQGPWTAGAVLPGGELGDGGFEAALTRLRQSKPWLGDALSWRLLRNYGSLVETLLGDATCLDDLGPHYGADLYEAELRHVVEREWVHSGDAFLWHRSKLGLHLTGEQRATVDRCIRTLMTQDKPTALAC